MKNLYPAMKTAKFCGFHEKRKNNRKIIHLDNFC